MKKAVFIYIVLISCVLISCNKNNEKFTITTDVESYSPLSSSLQGITLSVKTEEDEEGLEYYWSATDGTFKNSEKSEENGKTVLWRAAPLEETSSDLVTIRLIVKNKNSDKELAKLSIQFEKDKSNYIVK